MGCTKFLCEDAISFWGKLLWRSYHGYCLNISGSSSIFFICQRNWLLVVAGIDSCSLPSFSFHVVFIWNVIIPLQTTPYVMCFSLQLVSYPQISNILGQPVRRINDLFWHSFFYFTLQIFPGHTRGCFRCGAKGWLCMLIWEVQYFLLSPPFMWPMWFVLSFLLVSTPCILSSSKFMLD